MHITNIKIRNFRLIEDVSLELNDMKQDLSLLIGRNNSGKTSFIVLLEKFLSSSSPNFIFDDYPINLRDDIINFNENSDVSKCTISLILNIRYDGNDSLNNISDFILDLDPDENNVNILFECVIKKDSLLRSLESIKERRTEFIKKNISNFLEVNIYSFCDDSDIEVNNRYKLVKKEWNAVSRVINFQVIHAKRDVASSESSQKAKKVLSSLATAYFNKENKLSYDEQIGINKSIIEMDSKLNKEYEKYFKNLLKTSKEFLNLSDLKVVSDLQSQEILANHSKIVYGNIDEQLPEYLNGLGYTNIIYLLLQIEIIRSYFSEENRDINILFIEEPEAHTHPQIQYVFIDKIKKLLKGIPNLQTMITSHSSHIVNKCDFESIRYFLKSDAGKVEIKDFHRDLSLKYSNEKESFRFLKQYLTLNSSELFFAEKIIFIEGTTERILLPLFMKNLDNDNKNLPNYNPLSSQNITILEVGANAQSFKHFIDFLNISSLIITDIDTTKSNSNNNKSIGDAPKGERVSYIACPVNEGTHTSNASIKYFLNEPELKDINKHSDWMKKLKINQLKDDNGLIKVSYQIEEDGYHGRSFEDSFISINFNEIKKQMKNLDGLKCKASLNNLSSDFYEITNTILNGKSEFASSLLWLALSKENVKWKTPAYIKEGLLWIAMK